MRILLSTKINAIFLQMALTIAMPASAQLANEFYDPATLSSPVTIALPSQFDATTRTFVIKKTPFGYDVMSSKDAQFVIKTKEPVFVHSDSEALTSVLRSLLRAKGVVVSENDADTKNTLQASGRYEMHLFPHARRVIRVDKTLDIAAEPSSPSVLRRQGAGEASIDVATAITSGSLVQLAGSLIRATVDMTGAGAQIDKANRVEEKIREQFFRLGDCYDKTTRASSCEHGARRNLSLADKTRFQVFVLDVRLKQGSEEQRWQFVARRIDDRISRDAHLFDLLSLSTVEVANAFSSANEDK